MSRRPAAAPLLVIRYAAFAALAVGLNLATQGLALRLYAGPLNLPAAMALGTGAGLVAKYVLDRYWIFHRPSEGLADHAQTFALYAGTGVVTTALFWSVELASSAVFGRAFALWGGALGLVAGYACKYALDRRWVFGDRT